MKVPGIETARVTKNLTFSVAEYQDRLSRVRAQMAEQRLDVRVVTTPENIHYLSGYETPGYYCKQCLLVPLAGEPIHLTRGTEETNAKMSSSIDRTDSETVRVTETGCEVLTRFDRRLFVCPDGG